MTAKKETKNTKAPEGYVPSLQEIADHIGITKGAVSKYISTMEERGLLNKSGSHYGITTPKMEKVQKKRD